MHPLIEARVAPQLPVKAALARAHDQSPQRFDYISAMARQASASGIAPDTNNPLLTRLSRLASLSTAETELLRQMKRFERAHARGAELCTLGKIDPPRVIMSGWAVHQHISRHGRRQITQFLLPGDLLGAIHPSAPSVSSVVALTPVVLADARPLMQAIDSAGPAMPGLSAAMRLVLQAEEVRIRDHILRLGGQTAYERLTHLVLELYHRMSDIGAINGDDFNVPLTQEMLADTLGMSFVHTNRVLQQIRRDGLFAMQGRQVTLLQPDMMRTVADWAA